MAACILSPSASVSKKIVEALIVEDLIFQIEDLELRPHAFSRVFNVLYPAVNEVAFACRNPGLLDQVIAEQRRRATAGGPTCKQAFDLFIENMTDAG